ncbi:MAG TPA: glycosyltransferase family A protein, partial [Candidatus Tectomicrobia bacterium]
MSCLCVTEGRPAFMPWLLWCFDRQTWRQRELVLVDSSLAPLQMVGRNDVRVLSLPPGTRVGRKRNLALQEAHGEIITWFDDDDWQHPHKLVWLVEALQHGALYAGACRGWFVDLAAWRCAPYRGPKGHIAFNSAGFRKEAVLPLRFREDLVRASDTRWMRELATRYCGKAMLLDRDDMFFWLCHDKNLSNPATKRRFPERLDTLRKRIGAEAWGDTDAALEALRLRQQSGQGAQPRDGGPGHAAVVLTPVAQSQPWNAPQYTADDTLRKAAPPPLGVMIKATVLDAPFLDVMVRHMLSQARYPFAERTIVVDRPPAFSGKYRTRPRASQGELEGILEQLLADGIVDRVQEVHTTPTEVQEIMGRYFSVDAHCVPTHAATGGPIYATLFGLESMTTDYVLQMDADILFHVGLTSWVAQALQCLERDPRLWLMMTHPGPPAGLPGNSLGPRNARRATWDEALRIWRFRDATTRYFLCDRRQLRQRLRMVPWANGCAPLEQCISLALKRHGAFRGNLGDLESWHLHVWYHGEPFPRWARWLVRAIENGHFPACQRGNYDLRLDRAPDRRDWQELFERDGQAAPLPTQLLCNARCHALASEAQDKAARPLAASHRRSPGQAEPATSIPASAARQQKNTVSGPRTVPVAVVIPVRNRAGQRLRNALRSLRWQSAGPPVQVLVVSHGSQPEINRDLLHLCNAEAATLITVSDPAQPWNKPFALNRGIRATRPDLPFVLTMDADMILAPNFLGVVWERLREEPPALILCRISDLPAHAPLPYDGEQLMGVFDSLRAMTRLRHRHGSGGIQAARRSFFFDIRGYDEDLLWWGAMDGDMVHRARLTGLQIEWIEGRTAMLHQWHPRKHAVLSHQREIDQARRAWRYNHRLVQSRLQRAKRNPHG